MGHSNLLLLFILLISSCNFCPVYRVAQNKYKVASRRRPTATVRWLVFSLADGAPAHMMAKLPNSLDVNSLHCYVWRVMLEHFIPSQLQLMWDQLPQYLIDKAILSHFAAYLYSATELHKKTSSLRESWDGHMKHSLR